MAITSTVTIDLNVIPADQIPDGYTPPTAATLTAPTITKDLTMTIAAASFEHASNAVTGITAGIAAAQTEFDTNIDTTVLKWDAAATIDANVYIENIRRVNTRASEYLTGTENMELEYRVEWE